MERELLLRIVTASLLFAAVILWFFFTPDPWFALLLGLFAIVTTSELLVLTAVAPLRWFGMVTTAIWLFLIIGGALPVALLMLWLGWGLLLLLLAREGALASQFQSLTLASWMSVWLLLFVWMVLQLHHHPQGTLFLAGACLTIWASDIAAYFAGRAWGRRKLAPAISPGKSIEGLQAGIAVGALVGVSFWHAMLGMGYGLALLLALVVSLVGVAGDLMESALKRTVGAKESGTLLPGHGGILDRIDALLPSIPLAGMIWLKVVT